MALEQSQPNESDPVVTDPSTLAAQQDTSKLPSLLPNVTLSSNTLQVGQSITVTATLQNQGEIAALDVVLTLPIPDGMQVIAQPKDTSVVAKAVAASEVQQLTPQLRAGESISMTVVFQLDQEPVGRAVVFAMQATARDLPVPLSFTSGVQVPVVNQRAEDASIVFTPGSDTLLKNDTAQITLEVPGKAADQPLTLHARTIESASDDLRATGVTLPPIDVIGRRAPLRVYSLEAVDAGGKLVHQFTEPITLTFAYTSEQLQSSGISAGDLQLFWFDESQVITSTRGITQQGLWVPIPALVDPVAQTITAQVDHFSFFSITDGSSLSSTFIPSLEGWQTDLYTGAASYSYPINIPAGPAGVKPDLSLSYSSTATDGAVGIRKLQQTGWVGKGWNLEPPSIARNRLVKHAGTAQYEDYITLAINGRSYDIVLQNAPSADPTTWVWGALHEDYLKVKMVNLGASSAGRGGRFHHQNAQGQWIDTWATRWGWDVWTKDGTKYEFSEELWWGTKDCAHQSLSFESYKWLLKQSTDPNGNVISYHYARQPWTGGNEDCGNWEYIQGTVDQDAWLTSISWGKNINVSGSIDRFQVAFVSQPRWLDTTFDTASTGQYGGADGIPRQTKALTNIHIKTDSGAGWQLIRHYGLSYSSVYSDSRDSGCPCNAKLSLVSIGEIDAFNPPASAQFIPATSFSYETTYGTGPFAPAGLYRLKTVSNNYGGVVSFHYAHIGVVLGNNGQFMNRHRVSSADVADGRGNTYTTSYGYTGPALNGLGTIGNDLGWSGNSANPNSAVLFYNRYVTDGNSVRPPAEWYHYVAAPPLTEFRGHKQVSVVDPSGVRTEHYFHQGEASCGYPGTPGTTVLALEKTSAAFQANSCFQELRDAEFLKGKEYKTEVYGPTNQGTPLLTRTETSYWVNFLTYGYAGMDLRYGLWRAFTAVRATKQYLFNGTGSSLDQTTVYCYNAAQGGQYGNQTHSLFYEGALSTTTINTIVGNCDSPSVAPVRGVRRIYTQLISGTRYIVDRVGQELYFAGSINTLLAGTEYEYDGLQVTSLTLPWLMQDLPTTKGRLTMQRQFRLNSTSFTPSTSPIPLVDTRYEYDSYGNQTNSYTYAGEGQRTSGGSLGYSSAGGGSTARRQEIIYDTTFNTYPTTVKQYVGNGVILTESAQYNLATGWITDVTDPNGNTTSVSYDAFGRPLTIVKPGDTPASPTVLLSYRHTTLPFRYQIQRRVTSGQAAVRTERQFFDGLGRLIQTKRESQANAQNIVMDTRFDGLGRVTAVSQPRYLSQSGAALEDYTNPGSGALYNQTTTSYDGLSRVWQVAEPGVPTALTTTHIYSISDETVNSVLVRRASHTVIDPLRHATQYRSDAFGRLREVLEIAGDCGWWSQPCSNPFTTQYGEYARNIYSYDALDRLTTVTGPLGRSTGISYDTLGRKLSMNDPDMGAWSYAYHPFGAIASQTDAKSQVTSFSYDHLTRLTSMTMPGQTFNYVYDEAVPNGKGQRTRMILAVSGIDQSVTTWQFDTRGRKTKATHSLLGLATVKDVQWGYNSADDLTTLTYLDNEVVSYAYDLLGRQTSLTSSVSGATISNAIYTALDQPLARTYGTSPNQLTAAWEYTDVRGLLTRMTVPGAFDRRYTYDDVGNLKTIPNIFGNQTQNFTYDHRDRLTRAWTTVGAAESPSTPHWQALRPGSGQAFGPPYDGELHDVGARHAVPAAPAALTFDEGAKLLGMAGGSAMADGGHGPGLPNRVAGIPAALDAVLPALEAPARPAAQVSGLIAAYNFDAGSGTSLTDATGLGHTGTLVNGPTWTTQGKYGGALSFDGSNDLVTIADANDLDLTTGMTLEAWVYPTQSNSWRPVIFKAQSSSMCYALYGHTGDTNVPRGYIYRTAEVAASGSAALATNTWAHLAVTYDGAQLRFYLNGSLISSTAVTGPIATSTQGLSLGGNTLWNEYFAGRVDDVRIYNRALSAAEIVTDRDTAVGGGSTPTATPTATFTPTPTPIPGGGTTFVTTGDAEVKDNVPTTNFGTNPDLKAEGGVDPDRQSLLRFVVSGVSGSVTNAMVRVRVTSNDTVDGPTIYRIAEGWTETGVTWNNKPAQTSGALDDKGAMSSNTWYAYDVTSQVTGNGTYSFVLVSGSTDGVVFSSREGTHPPELVVTTGSSPTNTPTPTPTHTPTPTTGPTATPTPTPPPINVAPPSYDQSYSYDAIGNLVKKAGVVQRYGANGDGSGTGPHQVRVADGKLLTYDGNGNLTVDGKRWYNWTADNRPSSVTVAGAATTWNMSQVSHQIGRVDADGWSANVTQDNAAYLVYGPYTTSVAAGDQIVTWNMMVDNATADNATIATLEARNATTGVILASRVVTRQQFNTAYQYQGFSLPFNLPAGQVGNQLEFRIYWHDTSYLRVQNVIIQSRVNGTSETYRYDADGQRNAITRGSGTTITTYLIEGLWEETSGTVKRNYIFAGSLIAVRAGTTTSYIHSDHLGSVSATTSATGSLTSMQHYDPWGKVLTTGGTSPTKQNYTGQYLDDTGLLFYNARYYDPGIGRFVSADSIVPDPLSPQNLNRYSYVLNNPLRYTDPTGHAQRSGTINREGVRAIRDTVSAAQDALSNGSSMQYVIDVLVLLLGLPIAGVVALLATGGMQALNADVKVSADFLQKTLDATENIEGAQYIVERTENGHLIAHIYDKDGNYLQSIESDGISPLTSQSVVMNAALLSGERYAVPDGQLAPNLRDPTEAIGVPCNLSRRDSCIGRGIHFEERIQDAKKPQVICDGKRCRFGAPPNNAQHSDPAVP